MLDSRADDIVRTEKSRRVRHLPFLFVLPLQLNEGGNEAKEFLDLPPSLQAGVERRVMGWTDVYMQPNIAYQLRATIRWKTAEGRTQISETAYRLRVVSLVQATPPLSIDDFPKEFCLCSSIALRQNRRKPILGGITLFTSEPQPVVLNTTKPRASTVCHIHYRFDPAPMAPAKSCLQRLNCLVQSTLKVKTFYSTRPLKAMPGMTHVDRNPSLQVRTRSLHLDTRQMEIVPHAVGQDSVSPHISKQHNTSLQALFSVPINVSRDLLANFVCLYAARRYALAFEIKLVGFHHRPFHLEVPLQVIYDDHSSDTPTYEDSESSCGLAENTDTRSEVWDSLDSDNLSVSVLVITGVFFYGC